MRGLAAATTDQRQRSSVDVNEAVDRATAWLLDARHADGFWCGRLEADTTLSSDYVLYLCVLGDTARIPRLAADIRHRQLSDGGWNIYEDGPAELNASVKAYVALKLAGDVPDAAHMRRARTRIRALGGLERTNSFTRFYLALVGAVEWDLVPALLPELVILPSWFALNIYRMSSWTRAIAVPLTILYGLRPERTLLPGLRVEELFADPADRAIAFRPDQRVVRWRNVFLALDRGAKLYDRLPWKPFRRRALDAAVSWMLEHLERSDGLAAIYPAMMNSVFALLALGRDGDDALLAREIDHLRALEFEEGGVLRLQPCMSPVWDTAIAMVSLQDAGLPRDHPALLRAARWLLDRQITGPGDWQRRTPDAAPAGWAFEFRNEFYPDLDDTAFVLLALRGVDYPDPHRMEDAMAAGVRWLVAMQNDDGGWGAFDRNNDWHVLTHVPFADHNAIIDPSSADVTARVLECLAHFGRTAEDPVVKSGIEYLRREQTPDGAWYGRWGVNYVYGTSGVLRAAAALGLAQSDWCQRGAAWLRSIQNPDGGFGETCASYADARMKGRGPSTPSQTAWGLIGLLAAGTSSDPSVDRAATYLIESQNVHGSWDEHATTGTGFPQVFYLKYRLYCHSFPLHALARYAAAVSRGGAPGPRVAVFQ